MLVVFRPGDWPKRRAAGAETAVFQLVSRIYVRNIGQNSKIVATKYEPNMLPDIAVAPIDLKDFETP
jgi:hypothetical protein